MISPKGMGTIAPLWRVIILGVADRHRTGTGTKGPRRKACKHDLGGLAEADGNRTRQNRVATVLTGFEVRARHQRSKRFREKRETNSISRLTALHFA